MCPLRKHPVFGAVEAVVRDGSKFSTHKKIPVEEAGKNFFATKLFFEFDFRGEGEIFSVKADFHRVALFDFAGNNFFAQLRFDRVSQKTFERARAEVCVETFFGKRTDCLVRPREPNVDLIFQPLAQSLEQNFCNGFDLLLGQRLEDDDIIDSVQKFGAEIIFEQIFYNRLGFGESLVRDETDFRALKNFLRAEVARHDDDRVFEIYDAAFAVSQTSVVGRREFGARR